MNHLFHLAYIDPGTGSVVLQAIVGAVAGASYAVRHRIRAIMARFQRGPKAEKPSKS